MLLDGCSVSKEDFSRSGATARRKAFEGSSLRRCAAAGDILFPELNIEKPTSLIGIGEHTGFVLTKHAIAISSDEAVKQIAKRAWQDFCRHCQHRPTTPQLATNSQNRI